MTKRYMLSALLCASLALSACSAGGALSLLTGGGPKVAANVQAGKTNSQTIGTTNVTEQKLVRPQARTIRQTSDTSKVRTEKVGTLIVHEKDAAWLIWALAVSLAFGTAGWIHGWLTPSPRERRALRRAEEV